ncbi:opacity protein-like surface antigen [Rhodopseudomonas rhenobacensis]|uniref:Opacity protein-like surface antigen n=1 Tax=Rhodopseudomonas rhenobacensis TaxID=87461 RepID=A0A7W7Z355_9BRAD|nr:outer membrane beta-barrel protein [Rhodopseudomonas rhenobacensis]MBB5047094.1 opacity protein-like surface antigen [Rhodopseudomonas rhenobacensis]
MRSVKSLLAAGAASLLPITGAFAADMPIAPPPPAMYAPPPAEDFGGWYLRGDIGMTNQDLKFKDTNPASAGYQDRGFESASSTLFGLGVGYQVNNWFRADVTGQYRGKAALHGATNIYTSPSQILADNYSGNKSEFLVLANAYVDLGTWWCVTPFIGAGVGMANVKISGFRDDGAGYLPGSVPVLSTTYYDNVSKWNFAWAAHAGLAYKVSPNLTLELAYSYVDMGSVNLAGYTNYALGTGQSAYQLKNITSNDLKLGVRWNFDSAPTYAPAPLMRKG